MFGNNENTDQAQKANPSPRSTPKPASKPVSGHSTHVKSALKPSSVQKSRGASPVANAPSLSGAAHLAKRAVSSPKKSVSRAGSPQGGASRAGSPLAGDSGSRASSPVRDTGRSGSPPANVSHATSLATAAQSRPRPAPAPISTHRAAPGTPAPSNPPKKRKAEDGPSLPSKPDITPTKKPKKDRTELTTPFEGMLTDGPVIEFLHRFPSGVASKEIVNHFNEWLTKDERNKTVLTEIVKRVGTVEKINGAYVVTLKSP